MNRSMKSEKKKTPLLGDKRRGEVLVVEVVAVHSKFVRSSVSLTCDILVSIWYSLYSIVYTYPITKYRSICIIII